MAEGGGGGGILRARKRSSERMAMPLIMRIITLKRLRSIIGVGVGEKSGRVVPAVSVVCDGICWMDVGRVVVKEEVVVVVVVEAHDVCVGV